MPSEHAAIYNKTIWHRLRSLQLIREPLCLYCQNLGRVVPATVVDHVKPHRGSLELAYDPTNLQSLCAECHDRHAQRKDLGLPMAGMDSRGYPIDNEHEWGGG